jgi:hypothetical protein
MAEPPPPPFNVELSEQAQDDLARRPELAPAVNAVVLRAARPLRAHLEMGEELALDVHGRREALTVRVSLFPPDRVRVEGLAPGAPAPEGALVV